jgi:hypothetical protein
MTYYDIKEKEKIKELMRNSIYRLSLYVSFDYIRQLTHSNRIFSSEIRLEFNEATYSIIHDREVNFPKIEKRYNDLLTPEEIKSIITFETKRHLAFLKNITNHN